MVIAILTLSVLLLFSFLGLGLIVGYLVRQYFEDHRPIYTSHPELWDKETGELIVDSNILAIRVDNDYTSSFHAEEDEED